MPAMLANKVDILKPESMSTKTSVTTKSVPNSIAGFKVF